MAFGKVWLEASLIDLILFGIEQTMHKKQDQGIWISKIYFTYK